MQSLPVLSDYDVSPLTGFLPEKLPVQRLPEYYSSWESIVAIIPSLLLSNRLRKVIETLEVLETDKLETVEQQRRAYSVLGFIAHTYIWGNGAGTSVEAGPVDHLPKAIAQPWVEVSEMLQMPPVATYAGLCLWNWKFIINPDNINDASTWELDDFINNISTLNTFTGSTDESWFYQVSVFFEYRAAPCLPLGLNILKACRENNTPLVIELLQEFAERIDDLGSLLLKMEEFCDPHVFYFKLRPYLAGWKNMKSAGLKSDGVYYGDETEPRVLSGGSNAQSSFVQFMDLILNVNHTSTGEDGDNDSKENPFMAEMRQYMPKKHADFLVHLSKVNNLRSYVLEHSKESEELVLAFDAAVAMLSAFRDKHIRIVTRYIIIQASKKSKADSSVKRTGLAGQFDKDNSKKELRGTGGTSLLPFLKQCRDETGNAAAGYWGRRLLKFKNHPKEFAPSAPDSLDEKSFTRSADKK